MLLLLFSKLANSRAERRIRLSIGSGNCAILLLDLPWTFLRALFLPCFSTSTRQWIENLIFSVFLFFVFLSPRRIRDLLIFSFSLLCFLYIFVFARVQVAKVTSVESQDQRKLRILFLCFSMSQRREFSAETFGKPSRFRLAISGQVLCALLIYWVREPLHFTPLFSLRFDTRVYVDGFLINPLSLGLATSVQPLSSSHWIIFKHTSSTKHTSHAVEDGW